MKEKFEQSSKKRSGLIKTALSAVSGHCLSRNPVPIDQMFEADLKAIKGVRAWDGQFDHIFRDDIERSVHQEHDGDIISQQDGSSVYNILALSGGGSNGAFGAGFLCGWTQAGNRPKFKIVTGISTGSIIGALAFIGSEFDHVLKEIYTTVSTSNIYKTRNMVSWLWNDSFADTKPLKMLIEKYADRTVIEAVAKEHNSGRRLYVGTTNLDAQRFMVWNMGLIANCNHPDALELFRKVLLASLSVPGIFPPVYFDVEIDGKLYDEMHVDGSMVSDAFVCDFMLNFPAEKKNEKTHRNSVYVIRNDILMPSPEQVCSNIPTITRRAMSTLNKSHGKDHLHYIYNITRRYDGDFNYIGIPEDYAVLDRLTFDRKEMNKLFDLGEELAKSECKWHKEPPTFDT